jgi:ATP-binding cassette, subfamily B, bacterial PglK
VAAQAASLLMALSTVAGVAAITPFFAVLGDPGVIDRSVPLTWLFRHGGFHTERGFITALGVGFVGVVVITNLVNLLGAYALQRIALHIGDDMRALLFMEYLHRDSLYHANTHGTALCNNVAYETERSVVTTLQNVFTLVTQCVTIALVIGSIAFVNPLAAAAIVSVLIGGYGCIYLLLRQRIFRAGRLARALAEQRMKLILEALSAVKEIAVLHKQAFFQERFEQASRRASRIIGYIAAITLSPRYAMECIAVAGVVGSALALSSTAQATGQWLAELTFLGFAVYRLLPALQQAFAGIVNIRAAQASFAVIAADLKRARATQARPAAAQGVWHAGPRREIRLEEISFRYSPDAPPALDAVSLSIVPGTVVGIVGPSGCGKTTLVDILAGLLVPQSGAVRVDDIGIDESNRRSWQSHIAYVPQGFYLLDSTVAENIALGVAAEDIDRERMRAAARRASLDEFVSRLAQGYDEVIGERGVRLSGGQRQRLGIARALYTDASVVIMDEATNALDVLTEAEVMSAIKGLRGQRTIILIAHDMSALKSCDVIVELVKGKLVRRGSGPSSTAGPPPKAFADAF